MLLEASGFLGRLGHLGNRFGRPLGVLLGVPWGALGVLLDLLGTSWASVSAWKTLRARLEAPWHAPGELWESSWRCLGGVLEALGGLLEASGAFWGRLGGV